MTRAKAHTFFTNESGEPWADIRVWKRYIRPLSRDDLYVWWVENRTEDGWEAHDARGLAPDVVPDDWDQTVVEYDESCPSWQFVHRSHPEAIPVWVCGFKNDEPPQSPERGVS